MKRFVILMVAGILVGVYLSAQTGAGRGNTMYVAVKTVDLKDSTGFFGRTLAVLNLGDAVTVLRVNGKWMEVRSTGDPNLSGWIAAANLSSKRVTSSGRSVSGGELALAGKGFSAEIETEYRQGERLDYTAIDRLEAQNVPPRELLQFLNEGQLSSGE